MTRDQISKFDGYQVFDAGREFGSKFGESRELSGGWAQGIFFRDLQDGTYVPVGENTTFNTILVARMADCVAGTVAARKEGKPLR